MAKGFASRRGLKHRGGFAGSFNGARASRQRKRTAIARRQRGFVSTRGFFGRFSGPNAELKFLDQDINDATIASAGTIFTNGSAEATLLRITQGTGETNRIGRKCTIKSINWRFNIRLPEGTATTTTSDTVRIILYLDKQCNGAAATAVGILETDDYQSFNNLANKSRFRTLMDRTYDLNTDLSGDGTTVDSPRFNMNDSLFKRVNIPIEYDSTVGAIAEIRSNNINMLILSKNGLCTLDSKMRLRFSDV